MTCGFDLRGFSKHTGVFIGRSPVCALNLQTSFPLFAVERHAVGRLDVWMRTAVIEADTGPENEKFGIHLKYENRGSTLPLSPTEHQSRANPSCVSTT